MNCPQYIGFPRTFEFHKPSATRGIHASALTSATASMLLTVESTRTTLPTFTPRIRTGVPTQIPHAWENWNTTWYFLNRDRSWTPRSQAMARANSTAPETMNSPTAPSHTLVRPNPKSPSGCIVCHHSDLGNSRTAASGFFPFADDVNGDWFASEPEPTEAALTRRNRFKAWEELRELQAEGRNGGGSTELAEANIGFDSVRRIQGAKP